MVSNRVAITLIGLGCISAAGMGSYVATRQNIGGVAAPAVTAAVNTQPQPVSLPTPPLDAPAPAAQPLAEAVPVVESLPTPAPSQPTSPTPRAVATSLAAAPRPLRAREEAAPAERPIASPVVSAAPSPIPEPPSPPPAPEEPRIAEVPPAESSSRPLQELVVQPDSVIGLETSTALTSERARLEDRVEARVVRDVRVNGVVAIPAGTKALGTVVVVERGGKVRERARLGIRFQTLLLPDGSRLPMSTETIYRYGEPPGDRAAAKITGGVVAGAILGAIMNGGKGAAIGAAAGAGAGSAAVATADRNAAVFPAGAEVTARILAPITVTLDK